jgi:hypothetical protein
LSASIGIRPLPSEKIGIGAVVIDLILFPAVADDLHQDELKYPDRASSTLTQAMPDYPIRTLPDARRSLAVLKQRYLAGPLMAEAFVLLRQHIGTAIADHEAHLKIEQRAIQ